MERTDSAGPPGNVLFRPIRHTAIDAGRLVPSWRVVGKAYACQAMMVSA
jgi:hypothetical protein